MKNLLLIILIISISIFAEEEKLDIEQLYLEATASSLKYRDKVEPAQKKLIEAGVEVVPYLIENLDTKNAGEVHTLIRLLKSIGKSAVPDLIKVLKKNDRNRISLAIYILGEIKDSSSIDYIIKYKSDKDFRIVATVIEALGKFGDEKFYSYLIKSLSYKNEIVRKNAAYYLSNFKNADAIPYLIICLQDEFYGTRDAAYESLLKFEKNILLPYLLKKINTQKKPQVFYMIELLSQIESLETQKILERLLATNDTQILFYLTSSILKSGDKILMKKCLEEVEPINLPIKYNLAKIAQKLTD